VLSQLVFFPFGGTAVLIRKSFSLNSCKVVSNSLCLSAVCCQFKGGYNVVFGSVYMPYDDGSKDRAVEYEAIGILDRYIGCKFVFGGDLNVTKYSPSIEHGMVTNNLSWCNIDCNSGVNYTFNNDAIVIR